MSFIVNEIISATQHYQQFIAALLFLWGVPKGFRYTSRSYRKVRSWWSDDNLSRMFVFSRLMQHPQERKYVDFVVGKYSVIDFRGILQVENLGIRLPLRSVFVTLMLTEGAGPQIAVENRRNQISRVETFSAAAKRRHET